MNVGLGPQISSFVEINYKSFFFSKEPNERREVKKENKALKEVLLGMAGGSIRKRGLGGLGRERERGEGEGEQSPTEDGGFWVGIPAK